MGVGQGVGESQPCPTVSPSVHVSVNCYTSGGALSSSSYYYSLPNFELPCHEVIVSFLGNSKPLSLVATLIPVTPPTNHSCRRLILGTGECRGGCHRWFVVTVPIATATNDDASTTCVLGGATTNEQGIGVAMATPRIKFKSRSRTGYSPLYLVLYWHPHTAHVR